MRTGRDTRTTSRVLLDWASALLQTWTSCLPTVGHALSAGIEHSSMAKGLVNSNVSCKSMTIQLTMNIIKSDSQNLKAFIFTDKFHKAVAHEGKIIFPSPFYSLAHIKFMKEQIFFRTYYFQSLIPQCQSKSFWLRHYI